jgi:hypothetical protein
MEVQKTKKNRAITNQNFHEVSWLVKSSKKQITNFKLA